MTTGPVWNTEAEEDALADSLTLDGNYEAFLEKVKDKSYTFYVAIGSRVGAGLVASYMEYTVFHPNAGPESNDDFLFWIIKWQGMPYIVFGVPERFDPKVKEVAEGLLMRIADGVPLMIDHEGHHWFPGYKIAEEGRKNMWTIENTSGSQVYLNRKDLNDAAHAREIELTDALMRYAYQVPLELCRDYLWGLKTPAEQVPS